SFFFQAEDGIRDFHVTGVQTCALPILPVSWLKIDRSFIAGVERDERDRAIYRAVVAMARQLDLRVVAEGVENAGQYEFLRHIGCDEAQGFYCARPLVARRFERLLPAGARMRRGA